MKDRSDTDLKSRPKEQTLVALLQAAHALESKVEAALASVELSSPKYSVLTALAAANEPIALGELAERLSCVKSNVTQMIDRLEADGLVRRVPDPADRRSVKAEVTQLGRDRQAAGAAVMSELEARFSSAVATEDRSAVGRMLRSIDAA
jgi:DNA-binding MarR family transcriptional regulator